MLTPLEAVVRGPGNATAWISELTLAGNRNSCRSMSLQSDPARSLRTGVAGLMRPRRVRLPRLRLLAIGDGLALDNKFSGWVGESFHASPRTPVSFEALQRGAGEPIDVLLMDWTRVSPDLQRGIRENWNTWPGCRHAFAIDIAWRNGSRTKENHARTEAGMLLDGQVAPHVINTTLILEFHRLHPGLDRVGEESGIGDPFAMDPDPRSPIRQTVVPAVPAFSAGMRR